MTNCKQTAENCKETAENQKNWTPLKRILALPTWGQKCIVSELKPKDISNFDLGHPVCIEGYFPKNVEIGQKTVYDRGLVWAKTNCRSDMSGNLSFKFRA